jgi:hypothetical protein
MTSRIVTVGLVCASLYAAALGAGAVAQDEETTPAPTVAAETATPQAPESTTTATPSPFPSPVQTVVEATPEPTQTSTPQADPTAAPTSAPTQAPEQKQADAPAQTAAPAASPTATATPALGVDKSRRARNRKPNRVQGSAGVECDDRGKLVGTVVDPSVSTSSRECDSEEKDGEHADDHGPADTPAPVQLPDGTPTPANPGYSLATPGPVPIGVPNFFIDKFRIPPFLLPIYQAAGIQYGVRWEILAAINEIETDYGRNLNVSSAGALGWMQFMPATWDMYGVDANGDGEKDPFNPVDAIFAAARYLRAAGADKDLYRAIFAYNHADWYVESVLMRARVIGGLPADLVGSLTGLTQGRFPVAAKATYAGALPDSERRKRFAPGTNVANVVESDGTRRSIRIYSRKGAPVIAVQDGRVSRIGHSRKLGSFVELQDSYGNAYLYAGLGKLAETYPFPKERKAKRRELALPEGDPAPRRAASATTKSELAAKPRASHTVKAKPRRPAKQRLRASGATLPPALPAKERLFAHPDRANARPAGGAEQLAVADPGSMVLDGKRLDPRDFVPKPLKKGARISGGTILGRIGETGSELAPHVRFEIRPAGRGAPRIDPKPILDGWKLLESTAIYRSAKRNPFFGEDAETPSIGQIMLMSKQALQRHVLRNPHIDIYECGRHDVATGQVDRRVLATLEFLAASGLKPTVSSMRCGHGYYTAGGNVSEHSSGNAVDIAAVNGITITPATQGAGSITDLTIQRLLTLQGTMKPHQIISLMTFEGTDNTFAMGDHADHIHVGFRPLYGANSKAARRMAAVLKPDQWIKLIDRISEIDNPAVREQPSKFSVAVTKRASEAHRGE